MEDIFGARIEIGDPGWPVKDGLDQAQLALFILKIVRNASELMVNTYYVLDGYKKGG